VNYLIKHQHFSPFRHQHVMFIIKAPEFVLRQWYKHVVGIETTSSSATKDHAWNEISGRYTTIEEYYYPEVWRKQSENNKQASEGEIKEQGLMCNIYSDYIKDTMRTYKQMIDAGVAKEQARIILPLSQYSMVYWTASFQSIMNFVELRDEETAQWEIQEYAKALKKILVQLFPETTKSWLEYNNMN
jgi:thymidylate synthase (FAD)